MPGRLANGPFARVHQVVYRIIYVAVAEVGATGLNGAEGS